MIRLWGQKRGMVRLVAPTSMLSSHKVATMSGVRLYDPVNRSEISFFFFLHEISLCPKLVKNIYKKKSFWTPKKDYVQVQYTEPGFENIRKVLIFWKTRKAHTHTKGKKISNYMHNVFYWYIICLIKVDFLKIL